MAKPKPLPLSAELESAVIGAILRGAVPPDLVEAAELSNIGQLALRAIQSVPATVPLDSAAVLLAAVDGLGGSRPPLTEYLRACEKAATNGPDVLARVRNRRLLVDLANEVNNQLATGDFSADSLTGLIDQGAGSRGAHLDSVSALLRDGFPDPPAGLPVRSLTKLTGSTGGLYGVWVIGGEPKVGKTTLAWQITLDILRDPAWKALYYDPENGFAVMMDHTRRIFDNDLGRVRDATDRLFYRDNVRTLMGDLTAVSPPAVVVVDNIQKLPGSVEFSVQSLSRWMHRFESLKKRGYHVLLTSEVSNAFFGEPPRMGGYKGSGDIIYTADTGLYLLDAGEGCADLHIVANRHRRHRGYVTRLVRHRDWLWREA